MPRPTGPRYWDYSPTGHQGVIVLQSDTITDYTQSFTARIIANTALAAGGSSTLTIDSPAPATTYNSYQIFGTVGGKVGGVVVGKVMAAGGSAPVAGAVGGAAGSAAASAVGQTGAIAAGQQPGYSGTQFLVDVGMGTALGARAGAKAAAGGQAGPDTQGTAPVPEPTPVREPEVTPGLKAESTPVSDSAATPQQPKPGSAVSKTTRLDLGGKGIGDGAFITTTGDTVVVRVVSIVTAMDMAKILQAARQAGAKKGTLFTGSATDEVELIKYQRFARSGGTRFGGKVTQLSEDTFRLDFDEWPSFTN